MEKAPGLQASSQDPRVSGKESASADNGSAKRRCVSMACIACRRRKSKVSDSGWFIRVVLCGPDWLTWTTVV